MKIVLDPNLERALLRAIAEGTCPPSVVEPGELSKRGKAVHGALAHLLKRGAKPPIKPASIQLAAHSLSGFPKASADAYLKSFKEYQTGEEITSILATAREKAALVEVINAAGGQLSSGKLNAAEIFRTLDRTKVATSDAGLQALSTRVGDKFSKAPRGYDLVSLPNITKATNGLAGIWIIGGEPGLGKSTLALQIAVDVAESIPVVYYDIDGTGEAYFIERLRTVFNNSLSKFKRATGRLYYQPSIATLESTLTRIGPPGLIVVDSIQTLPNVQKLGKESTDEWLRRFKDLVGRGYCILGVSEKPRSHYGAAEMGGYKGTGDIEYSGTICAHVIADEDEDNILRFIIVKNRHGPTKGHITNLIRDDDRVFWFQEEKIRNYGERRKKK